MQNFMKINLKDIKFVKDQKALRAVTNLIKIKLLNEFLDVKCYVKFLIPKIVSHNLTLHYCFQHSLHNQNQL